MTNIAGFIKEITLDRITMFVYFSPSFRIQIDLSVQKMFLPGRTLSKEIFIVKYHWK
jgi:hypothetical protein